MSGRPRLEIAAILRALDARGVEYVVIGGVAGRAHGDPTVTYDLDITPAASHDNLRRLAGALDDMRVGLRVPDLDETDRVRVRRDVDRGSRRSRPVARTATSTSSPASLRNREGWRGR